MRLSVTARIALLSIVLALVSNVAVALFVREQARTGTIDAIQRSTVEQADALAAAFRTGGAAALDSAIAEANVPGDPTLVAMIADDAGRRVAGAGPDRVSVPIEPTRFAIGPIAHDGDFAVDDTGYALRRVGSRWLLIGRVFALVNQQERALERALGVALLLAIALGVLTGLILTRYVSQRLARITGVIEAAGAGDLSQRVGLGAGGGDAFDRLAARLNDMLARIERLMTELRVISDGLAHDLRSPLARLRSKTEQAVMGDPADREAALGGLLAETDHVMRMLTTVIEISRAEQVSRDRFTPLAPESLLEEVADLYAPVVEDTGGACVLAIEAHSAPIPIHRELMSQAIANLVDNALKHGGSPATITLRLSRNSREVTIAVEDRGPGIAATDRAAAVRRFGRLDAARSVPGAGLGMALVEAVARLHGGRIELADNAPGLAARIVLPI